MECHLRNFARPTNGVFGFQGTLVLLIVIIAMAFFVNKFLYLL
jgi:hypothetical protein